jgi:hypothetical protein
MRGCDVDFVEMGKDAAPPPMTVILNWQAELSTGKK